MIFRSPVSWFLEAGPGSFTKLSPRSVASWWLPSSLAVNSLKIFTNVDRGRRRECGQEAGVIRVRLEACEQSEPWGLTWLGPVTPCPSSLRPAPKGATWESQQGCDHQQPGALLPSL